MERMLGNQLFMVGRFEDAIPHFEKRLHEEPDDALTLRNLIVCYVVADNLDLALKKLQQLLHQVLGNEKKVLRHVKECPCRSVLSEWYRKPPNSVSRFHYLTSMAILALFCEPDLGCAYLRQARKLAPENRLICEISEMLPDENANNNWSLASNHPY